MKLNKEKWLERRLYYWRIAEKSVCFRGYVTVYKFKSTAHNIGESVLLNQILHDTSFSDFFTVRRYCKRHSDKYTFTWEPAIDLEK